MNKSIMNRTHIQVTMRLETDNPALEMLIQFIAFVWWRLQVLVNWVRYEITMFWQDFKQAALFTGKVFAIGFNSWAWALLGVKL